MQKWWQISSEVALLLVPVTEYCFGVEDTAYQISVLMRLSIPVLEGRLA